MIHLLDPIIEKLGVANSTSGVIFGLAAFTLLYWSFSRSRPYAAFPLVTLKYSGLQAWLPTKYTSRNRYPELFNKGATEVQGCFQILASTGYKIVVPNRFADELKDNPHASFNAGVERDFFVDWPGFEGWKASLSDDKIFLDTVRVKLTQSLNLITDDLIEEASSAVHDQLGESSRWVTKTIKGDAYRMIARMSTRVFLGADMARNAEWLDLSERYAIEAFVAPLTLHAFPKLLQRFLNRVLPASRRLRQHLDHARRLIAPELAQRSQRVADALANNEKPPKAQDSIGWMVQVAKGRRYDYAAAQLQLGVAAIHTTSEMLVQAIVRLCENPEVIAPLREEIVQVLREDGWAKTTLYKLKLMDSFLKEVARIQGFALATLNRYLNRPITLSDGTVLPKGATIMVLRDQAHDPAIYHQPQKLDAWRYLNMRSQPGQEQRHQFVTTSSENMGFGHGPHACPGRFFAAVELKILLSFLILKYDVSFLPGESMPANIPFEQNNNTDPMARIRLRRRAEEIDLLEPKGRA